MHDLAQCPICKEPVKPHWSICPVCETRLRELLCPSCRQPVKENWKRCPECETSLNASGPRTTLSPPVAALAAAPLKPDASNLFRDSVCGVEMVYVTAGSFQMGDIFGYGTENELPVRTIQLDGFYMAIHCVLQEQWERLMHENPSHHQGPELPVEQVTWEQAVRFADLLTTAHQDRYRFTLPSEAQWEYAARSAGKPELYAGGDAIDALAWYEANSQGHTHPAGLKTPNGLGLHDMSGNVWEWCGDTFVDDAYQRHPGGNPLIVDPGPDRVIRGGSFHLDAWSARCSRRLGFAADFIGPALGFRLVMQPGSAR